MKIGLVMQHRPFSLGEGIRGMRQNSEQEVQVSDPEFRRFAPRRGKRNER